MKNIIDHNSFYIITGGLGVGKTSLIDELKKRGMSVVPEIARKLIEEQQTIDGEALPWKNKKLYMDTMFQRSVESFEKTSIDFTGTTPLFFDRGFLDALCYAALEGIPINQEMKAIAENMRYNTSVFILPPWQETYQIDERWKQDWNEAVFTYNKIIQTYRGYDYDLVEVPKAPVEKRADFILHYIKNG